MEAAGVVCLFALASYDDIRIRQVRLAEIIFFGILGVVFNLCFKPYTALDVAGGVAVGLFVLLFSIASHEKIGRGDAYIIMVAGLYLGFFDTAALLWISSVIAAITGAVFTKGHKGEDAELPFVPFLLAGYMIMMAIKLIGGLLT